MSGDKLAPPTEYPMGDIIYNWMLLRMNDLLLELREYLNSLGLSITQHSDTIMETLMEDIQEYLNPQEDTNDVVE